MGHRGLVGSNNGGLTDAAVQGVDLRTSSAGAGTTDALGQYRYNPGDTVTFSLDALTLGAVPATAVVMPTELAGGRANKQQHLLMLLQSLDSDGVATNGISIPAAAAQTAGGINRPISGSSAAEAHFLDLSPGLVGQSGLARQRGQRRWHPVRAFRCRRKNLDAQIGPSKDGGRSGGEYGTCADNSSSRAFRVLTVTVDTKGCAGLHDNQTGTLARFNPARNTDGSIASVTEDSENFTRFRISR